MAEGLTGEKYDPQFSIKNVKRLDIHAESARFVFRFHDFIAYSVTEEMYIKASDETVVEDGRVRLISDSEFLDFVKATTWAETAQDGRLLHYQLSTLDHRVDVVTPHPPEFTHT